MAYRDKLAKKADLGDGEQMLAGTTATPAGGLRRNAATMGAGAAMGVAGAAATAAVQQAADAKTSDSEAGFPTASKMAIGLTDRRILVWSLGVMTGGPNKLIGAVPVSSVRDVAYGSGKTMGIRNGVLELTFTDGEVVSLEVPRIHLAEGEVLAEALRSMVPATD
jgi:hypothetical protein